METLRLGIVGSGFNAQFHLRALESVRGVDVAGITSRTPPTALAASVRERGLGEARVFATVREMAENVDVVAICNANSSRVDVMEEIAAAVDGGARLRGLICEKPLARNLPEARRVLELTKRVGAPTAYFENQIHMKMLQQARVQLAESAAAMGPLTLVRAAEEHGGPHSAWFWDPTQQGGGVLSDMGCHSIAVGRYLLTPGGKALSFLEPQSVSAHVSLLKWGQPRWREELWQRHGVDYSRVPAEDFATGLVTYRNPETGQHTLAQFTVSWMYDKQGLRLLVDGIGPGYALEANSLRSPLEVFIGDAAASSVADAELALEKATASAGSARDPAQRARPVRLHRREPRRVRGVPRGSKRVARLRRRVRGRAPHDGRVPVGRAGSHGRPHRCGHARVARRLRAAHPAGAGAGGIPGTGAIMSWVTAPVGS